MDKEIQDKIGQIQLIQQNLHNFSSQRQQFQIQQTEVETALGEIEKTSKTYKIIGNIMVAMEKSDIKKELEEKKQMLTIRINSVEKQEAAMRERAETIQKEVMSKLETKQEPKSKKRQ